MSQTHSFFLVIEGLDGTGKSEVSRHLAHMLRETMGERVLLTFEPHDPSAAGLFIRQVLTKRVKTSARALALAFALNRADHNERAILPFLNADSPRVVICDRYYLSSLVYQSSAEQPMEAVMALNSAARRPDLTLFLYASPRTCYDRIRSRLGDHELFETNLSAMRAKYDTAIAFLRGRGETILEISAEDSLPTVLNRCIDALRQHAPAWLDMQHILLAEFHAERDADAEAQIDYDGMITTFVTDLPPAKDKRSLRAALVELKKRIMAEVERMNAAQLGALLLMALTRRGYEIEERLTWGDVTAYEIAYLLPGVNVKQRGIALLMREGGRYGAITRKLQELEERYADQTAGVDFVLVLDPARLHTPPPIQYRRDYAPRLFPNTQIIGREDVFAWLWAASSETFYRSLDETLQLQAMTLIVEIGA